MNNLELDAFRADLAAWIERALKAEQFPACRDCVHRALSARLLPANAIILNIHAFAEEIAQAAIERIKVIQGRALG
jgi:hypothetical protein